jgi:hypothetical protein
MIRYIIISLFLILLLSCKKDVNYTIYYSVEIQPADYTKPYEAKIYYTNSEGKPTNQTITTTAWNASRFARSDDNANIRVQGIQNIALINVIVTINGKKYFNTCNELNCWVEVNENLH